MKPNSPSQPFPTRLSRKENECSSDSHLPPSQLQICPPRAVLGLLTSRPLTQGGAKVGFVVRMQNTDFVLVLNVILFPIRTTINLLLPKPLHSLCTGVCQPSYQVLGAPQ